MAENKCCVEKVQTYNIYHISEEIIDMIICGLGKMSVADAKEATIKDDFLRELQRVRNDDRE